MLGCFVYFEGVSSGLMYGQQLCHIFVYKYIFNRAGSLSPFLFCSLDDSAKPCDRKGNAFILLCADGILLAAASVCDI